MLTKIIENKLLLIGLHLLVGFLAVSPIFSKFYGVLVIIIGVTIIFLSSNKNEEALLLSSYIVGLEVFTRMTDGSLLYETGKYGVILFLILGIIVGPIKQRFHVGFLFYPLLLLLGIVFTRVPEGESIRKAISFNLSGPFTLGVCALYMYKRNIRFSELKKLLFMMLLPMFSMVSYIYFRTPDLKDMIFGTNSNFDLSGGFGPNQVATIIGAGMFILASFIYLKVKISGFIILDALFLAYFTYRGLLTFSRGGILTAAVAFVLFSFFLILYKKGALKSLFKYVFISILFIVGVWLYTSNITDGMIDNRYTVKDRSGRQKDITTGRVDIFVNQIESFKEAPFFGIGVGNGKFKREKEGVYFAASHNELSRLIEEHGLIGIIILVILLYIPAKHFLESANFQKAFVVSFLVFWFLTINHSAMRIAFPAFIYGLGLINITHIKELKS